MTTFQIIRHMVVRMLLIFLPACGVLVMGEHTTALLVRAGVFLVIFGGVAFFYYRGLTVLDSGRPDALDAYTSYVERGDALATALGLFCGVASIWTVGSNGETWIYWWWLGAVLLAFPILKRGWDLQTMGLYGEQYLLRTILAFGPLSYVAALNALLFLANQQPLNTVSPDGLETTAWTYACFAAAGGMLIAAFGMWYVRYSPAHRWKD